MVVFPLNYTMSCRPMLLESADSKDPPANRPLNYFESTRNYVITASQRYSETDRLRQTDTER